MDRQTQWDDMDRHSEDVQDIITKVPSWILRWGTTIFFGGFILIFSFSAFIRYPEIANASLVISSPNTPKAMVPKISGKITSLLVRENDEVFAGQPLLYIESTGNHHEILQLIETLRSLQKQDLQINNVDLQLPQKSTISQLGELQAAYEIFYQSYLDYKSSLENGVNKKKRQFLETDLLNMSAQKDQLEEQQKIQKRDFALAEDDYAMHKKLEKERVETIAEMRQAESKYLAKKSPIIQTEASIINLRTSYTAKQNEILTLDNQIAEQKSKFVQSLNSLLSQAEEWKSKYVLSAPQKGKINFSEPIQQNQTITENQEVFYINSGDDHYFGEMNIPQNNMGKIKIGQSVLIKLQAYPFEEFGIIRGKITYLSEIPLKDGSFDSKVILTVKGAEHLKKPITLKPGMAASAEIITEQATLLQRIWRNIIKVTSTT